MRVEVHSWPGPGRATEADVRRRLEAEGFECFVWCDPPDAAYTPHVHSHDESLWVVEGEMSFGIEGQKYRLGAGDRLMLPAGTAHTAQAGQHGATYLVGQRRG